MPPDYLLAAYSALILLASLLGGWIPLWVRLTHTRLQVATSFVAGLMLGVGLLHLLPHAWHQLRAIDRTMGWVLAGFVTMFFIQRFFQFHQHEVAEETHEHPDLDQGSDHVHQDSSAGCEHTTHRLSWAGAAAGLTLHTVIDGVALAASVASETTGQMTSAVAGLGTFLVIILHKPFDAMTIGTLLAAGGWSRGVRHLINAAFALAIPLGVLFFHACAVQYGPREHVLVGAALAFAAGTFLCIAGSDLLPELHFHTHDRVKLSLALLAGVALAILVGQFEHAGHDQTPRQRGQASLEIPAVSWLPPTLHLIRPSS